MKVSRLIELLNDCPPDLNIVLYYDGAPRLNPNMCYLQEKDEYHTETIVVLGESDDIYNLTDKNTIFFEDGGDE